MAGSLPKTTCSCPSSRSKVSSITTDRRVTADGGLELFDASAWASVAGFEDLTDITYHRAVDAAVRPHRVRPARGAQRVPSAHGRRAVPRRSTTPGMSTDVGCVLLTGNGPSPKDGGWAFCSGGDQRIRGKDGYQYAEGEPPRPIDPGRSRRRLHILEVQRLIRFMPKVVICVVPGLGGRRRPLAARRVRPHARQPRARAASSRPTPTSRASTAASGRPTSPARSGRSSPARSSSSATSTPPRTPTGWAWSTRSSPTPNSRRPRWTGAARSARRARPRSGC